MSPLFVSASSWMVISMDNKKSIPIKSFYKDDTKSPFKIAGDGNTSADTPTAPPKNYYSKDYSTNEDFVFDNRSYFNLSKDCHSQREVASLTKIMTCYTVLKLLEKMKINKIKEEVTIS